MVHVAFLIGGFIVLLVVARDQWFIDDDWEFLADRTITGGTRGVFVPHNEHWVTIPVLIYGALFAVVGLKTYLPYMAVLLVFHAGVVHATWRLMRRCGSDPWISTGAAGILLVFGYGAANILWPFQVSFVGALLAGLVQILLLDRDGPFGRRDVVAVVVGTVGLLFSGIAVPMAVMAGGFALLRRGWRTALAVVGVPAVVYMLWLVVVGRRGLDTELSPSASSLAQVPQFVWTGLRGTLEGATGSAAGAAALAAGVAALVVLRVRRKKGIPLPAAATAAGAVVVLAIVGASRAQLGIQFAYSSRYAYLIGALLLPLVALALTELADRSPVGLPAALLLVGLAVVGSFVTLVHRADRQAAHEQAQRRAVFAARELATSGALLVADAPASHLQIRDLDRLDRLGALPDPPALTAGDRFNAVALLQVSLSNRPRVPIADGSVEVLRLRGATVDEDGPCATIRPSPRGAFFLLGYGQPSSVSVRSPGQPARLEVVLRRRHEQPRTSLPTALHLYPGPARYLNLAAPEVVAEVRVPAIEELEVCHAGSWPAPGPVA